MNNAGTLHGLGFTAAEVRRLQALQQQYQRGEFHEALSLKELRRLKFVRWLIAQERLSR